MYKNNFRSFGKSNKSSFQPVEKTYRSKVYIAGKVTGEPIQECKEKFSKAEFFLRRKGHDTVNPLRLAPADSDWQSAMKICVRHLTECDEIFMLRDWQRSRGAQVEHYIAEKLGIKVNFEGEHDAV